MIQEFSVKDDFFFYGITFFDHFDIPFMFDIPIFVLHQLIFVVYKKKNIMYNTIYDTKTKVLPMNKERL